MYTLNVNSTGAKAIRYKNVAITAGYLVANKTYLFAYDGTYWQLVGDVDTNTTYSAATTTAAGLMSADDKKKLDSVAAGANNYSYTLPAASGTVRGGVKVGYTANGKNYPVQLANEQMFVNVPWTDNNTTYSNMKGASASADGTAGLVPAPTKGNQTKYLRADGTWQTPPDTNTTYSAATQSVAGLMSAADKKKLDGLGNTSSGSLVSVVEGSVGANKTSIQISIPATAKSALVEYWTLALTESNFNTYGSAYISSFATISNLSGKNITRPETESKPVTAIPAIIEIGDEVYFKGGYHYISSTATEPTGGKRTAGRAKIQYIAPNAPHCYALTPVEGGSNVYGWVDADLVEPIEETPDALQLGDKVTVKSGATDYKGRGLASFVYKNVYTVMQIGCGIAPDYIVIGVNGDVTAAVKAEDLKRHKM